MHENYKLKEDDALMQMQPIINQSFSQPLLKVGSHIVFLVGNLILVLSFV